MTIDAVLTGNVAVIEQRWRPHREAFVTIFTAINVGYIGMNRIIRHLALCGDPIVAGTAIIRDAFVIKAAGRPGRRTMAGLTVLTAGMAVWLGRCVCSTVTVAIFTFSKHRSVIRFDRFPGGIDVAVIAALGTLDMVVSLFGGGNLRHFGMATITGLGNTFEDAANMATITGGIDMRAR